MTFEKWMSLASVLIAGIALGGHWIPTHNHGVSMPEYAVEIPLSKEAQSILTAVHSIPLVTVYSPDDTTLKLYLDPGGVTKNE